jgi:hypothetical protein
MCLASLCPSTIVAAILVIQELNVLVYKRKFRITEYVIAWEKTHTDHNILKIHKPHHFDS